MPKEEWGTKRVCPTTGRRFYDLGRSPIVSPYTGEVVAIDTGKGSRTMIADKPDKDAKIKDEAVEEEDVVVLDDDDDEDAPETVEADLGDDVLDDDEEDTVSLDDVVDVASEDDDS